MAIAPWPPVYQRPAAWIDWLLAAAIASYLLFVHVPLLTAWPPVNSDEGREANAFWVGCGVDPSARTLDPIYQHDPLYKGGLQGLTTCISFRTLGFGLFQGRLVSIVWAGALVWFTYLAGRRLYGVGPAISAAILLVVSQPFLVSSHIIRPDIMVAALVMGALYSALRGLTDGGRVWHFAAGLLLGLSFDVHPNTLAFMPLVGMAYVMRYGARFLATRDAWIFVAGLSLAAAYYVAARILPDPAHYAEAFRYWIGVDKPPPIVSRRGESPLSAELGRWTSYFAGRAVEAFALGLGVVWAVWRSISSRRVDLLLTGLAIALGVFVVLVSSKTEYYTVLFYPMLALMVGGAIVQAVPVGAVGRLIGLGLVAAMGIGAFGFEDNYRDMLEASDRTDRDYAALSHELRGAVPPGSRVVAPPIYWIGLSEPPYYLDYVDFYVWERLNRETAGRRLSWPDFLRQIEPQYVILDSKAKADIARSGLPRYMEDNADLVLAVRHVSYTRVEVWKLREPRR